MSQDPEVHHSTKNQETMNEVRHSILLSKSQIGKQNGQSQEIKVTVKEGVMKIVNLQRDKRFLRIVPQSLWTGVSIAYFSGNLVQMLQDSIGGNDDQYQFKYSMLAMVAFGLGEVLGCFFIGFIVDRLGSKLAVCFNILIILIMTGFTIAFILVFQFNVLAFIMCFMWGFQDSAINTHTSEILGFEFNDNYTPFSLFNILQCIACFVFQLILSQINGHSSYLYFTIGVCVKKDRLLSLICCGATYFFPFHETKSHNVDLKSFLSRSHIPEPIKEVNNTYETSTLRELNYDSQKGDTALQSQLLY